MLLNSFGAEIKYLAKPDVRMLVDATQGGANQHIRLTMQPARPSLSDSLRITDRLEKPAAEKWGGTSAHRRAVAPESGHGLVSIAGRNGLFYANAVGTFGSASAGQNWDRLARASRRRALKLVGAKKSVLIIARRRTFLGGRWDLRRVF